MPGFSVLASLFTHFLAITVLAVGGFMVTVPDIHRWMVSDAGLLTHEVFNAAIALGQAAPGPNVLIVWVLGWFAAGPAGAVAALSGAAVSFTTMSVLAGRTCRHYAQTLLVRAWRAGLAPVSIGLLFATGFVLLGKDPAPAQCVIAAVTTILVWKTRVSMLALIAGGAAAGLLGFC